MIGYRRLSDRRINAIAGLAGLLVVAAIVVVALELTSSSPVHESERRQPFAVDSIWNRALPTTAAVAPDSPALVAQLMGELRSDGAWIDTYKYSVPVYTVGPGQAKVPVILDTSGPGSADELASTLRSGVPIPAGATAAPGTDEHMVVLQPATNTMWEFWHMHKVGGGWHASWGGKMTDVSSNPGYFTNPPDWGATATSIPLLAGLMRIRELESGHIDHALALAIPKASAAHVLPAQRSDGYDHSAGGIPEGTRFRIKPGVDVSALHLPRLTLMMARAVQRYGMIVRDQSGAVTFYGEQATAGVADPYYGKRGLFEGKDPAEILQGFPWQDLEVVAPPSSPG